MSELTDRVMLSIIVVTAVVALLGWLVGAEVIHLPPGVTNYALPVVFLVVLVALVAVAWKWFDVID